MQKTTRQNESAADPAKRDNTAVTALYQAFTQILQCGERETDTGRRDAFFQAACIVGETAEHGNYVTT